MATIKEEITKKSNEREKDAIKESISDYAKNGMKDAKKSFDKMKKGLEAETQEMKKRATDEVERIKADVKEGAQKIEGYAKKNPKKAAAISAGVGAALGVGLAMLLQKKKKKRKEDDKKKKH